MFTLQGRTLTHIVPIWNAFLCNNLGGTDIWIRGIRPTDQKCVRKVDIHIFLVILAWVVKYACSLSDRKALTSYGNFNPNADFVPPGYHLTILSNNLFLVLLPIQIITVSFKWSRDNFGSVIRRQFAIASPVLSLFGFASHPMSAL